MLSTLNNPQDLDLWSIWRLLFWFNELWQWHIRAQVSHSVAW